MVFMYKRKLDDELIRWKSSSIRKPLILRGARQVGKTSVVRLFAENNFSDLFEINLENKEHFRIFEGVSSVNDFLKRMEIVWNRKFEAAKALLFIDEIQESQDVLNLLRFFAEDRPDIYLVATGSLLEAKLAPGYKVPVGRVEYKYLYPLTFSEYLEATGNTVLKNEIMNIRLGDRCDWEKIAINEFKKYAFIGGMPEVVANFAKRQDFFETKQILSRLYATYIDDVAKYAKKLSEKKYLEWVVEAGPRFAGGLFRYENFGGSQFRSREMSAAFRTVEKIMVLKQVVSVNSTNLPLNYKFKRPKKLIWLDVGIVNYCNNAYPDLLKNVYSGKTMEQIVGQNLIAEFKEGPMDFGYWAKDKDQGSAEVDFCWQWKDKIVGLEVKSGTALKSRSLFNMVKAGAGRVIPVRVSWNKLSLGQDKVLLVPFYLLERIDEFLGAAGA